MRGEFGLQEGDEIGFHELIVVGDAEDDERFVAELGGEALRHGGGVLFLHAENHFGPTNVAGGEFHTGAVDCAGGASLVARMIAEKRLGGGGAPLVARAEEEELGLRGVDGAGRTPEA